MKFRKKRLLAFLVAAVMFVAAIPFNGILAAATDKVSITLYNDSVLEGDSLTPTPHTSSYVWKTDKNASNVFRLVVNVEFAQTYKPGEVQISIDGFNSIGRSYPITRKSFGNESGVFTEIGTESFDSGIVAKNSSTINGSAMFSVTYQFKPEEIKDLGTMGQPLAIKCTMKAGSKTVTSNTISFSTEFEQGWSIINSGDHDEAYDEIEVYKIDNNAPFIHKDRLVTIDGTTVASTTVANSDYYWAEYRVPVLSHDPLGLYNHFIEINIPDGCVFYSAQFEAEDLLSPPETLTYSINSSENKVTVNCVDFANKAHSADETDFYYYFVIALNKNVYSNADAITFREKRVHKDSKSVVYSDNTESLDLSINGWGERNPSYTRISTFNLKVATEDFISGYTQSNEATLFSLPITSNMRINSTVPFISSGKEQSSPKTYLNTNEFDIFSVEIPAHYLNDNGETVYGVSYSLYTSQDGSNYNKYISETITADKTVLLPDNTNYAYVVYSPTDKSSSKSFHTFGSGTYSYRVSPVFRYEFKLDNDTYRQLETGLASYVGITITGEDNDNRGVRSSIVNYIANEKLTKVFGVKTDIEASVRPAGNKYIVTPEYDIHYYSNSVKRDFSSMDLIAVLPSNFYGSSNGSAETLINTISNSVEISAINNDNPDELQPLVIEKTNGDGSVTNLTVDQNNIKDFVKISHRITANGNAVIAFSVDFKEYVLKTNFGLNSWHFSFSWPMARLSDEELGEKKTFDMTLAMFGSESVAPAGNTQSVIRPTEHTFASKDDGSFASEVSSISVSSSDLRDANNNGNTSEKAYFAKSNISVLDTGEAAQFTSIMVETELTPLSFTTFANPAKTRSGKEYTLSFVFESYNANYKEIAFISTLGNHESDGSDWTGTFLNVESVTSNSSEDLSYNVYYTTKDIDVTEETTDYAGENRLSALTWKDIADCNDYSSVKAIAVVAKKANGTSFDKEDSIICNVKMLADASDDYNRLYNKVKFGCAGYSSQTTTSAEKKSSAFSDFVVIQKFNPTVTYIKRIKASSVNAENGIPTFIVECGNENEGASFVFRFDEGYKTVDINGEEYYEMSYTVKNKLGFGSYVTNEKDSLRYGAPVIQVTEGDGTVNGRNSVSFETSFENADITIISTSEKEIYRGLTHNDLCVNKFDNKVKS